MSGSDAPIIGKILEIGLSATFLQHRYLLADCNWYLLPDFWPITLILLIIWQNFMYEIKREFCMKHVEIE